METTKIALFKGKKNRKLLCENEWYFSVIDVVEALTDSVNPRDYWFKMKIRVKSEDEIELSTICRQLKLEAPDGKMRETDCANTESVFRIIQSIPSPKAEPFKRWLAKVGYERVQDCQNLKNRLNNQNRLTILSIKAQLWNHPSYRDTVTSQDIYDAVFDHGILSLDGFWEYMKKK